MKPLDPRLLRLAKATRWYLAIVVALGILASASTVVIACNLSLFVVKIFIESEEVSNTWSLLVFAAIAAVIRASVVFLQEVAGNAAAAAVKLDLRDKALNVLDREGSGLVVQYGTGFLSELLGPRLDSLDVYFSKYLPQLVFSILVTPIIGAIIWFQDFTSGLIVLFTLPLIPLFMALIGIVTKDLQSAQLDALAKLKGHFHEVLKGLLTLKSFGRDRLQSQVLFEVSESYRLRTMKVLRISFLSGFALELAASLSVALIAVSIGLRLVEGQMSLFTGLFVLMLAPEVYLPLRNVGVQFHAASEGVEVSSRVLDLIETTQLPQPELSRLEESDFLVITGPSGSGKSTLLKANAQSGAWMPQTSTLLAGTIVSNIVGPGEPISSALARSLEIAHIDFDIDQRIESSEALSGGQVQRIALARTLYLGFSTNKKSFYLDEPLAAVDLRLQRKIVEALVKLVAEGYRFSVVSHQKLLIDAATKVVKLG
jgi:ATP-binding cassette, subfamily C, bacterial CydD